MVIRKFTLLKCTIIAITAAIAFCLTARAQNTVTTHAGSSQGYVDAIGTSAKFKAPTGICISNDGASLYIADYTGHRIRKVNVATKAVTTVAGSGTSGYADGIGTAAQFSYPSGICISSDGTTLYVTDYGNSYIRKINIASQTVSTIAGNGTFSYSDNIIGLSAGFNSPTDLVNIGDSILYISDTENQLIRKLNISTTEVSTLAGMAGFPGFQNGVGSNAAFRYPKGLAVTEDGTTLFVADNGNNLIRSIDLSTKNVFTVAGDGTAGFADNSDGMLAKFNSPNGVAIVPGMPDLLYVADNANHRIRQINLTTTAVTTIAGTGAVPPASTFADNSVGINARFFYPTNLKVSPDAKDLYVADQGNFRVRKVKTDLNLTIINNTRMEKPLFEIFPNPCSQILTITLPDGQNQKLNLRFYDSKGRMVYQSEKTSTTNEPVYENISSLAAGIYFVAVSTGKEFSTQKLMIIK